MKQMGDQNDAYSKLQMCQCAPQGFRPALQNSGLSLHAPERQFLETADLDEFRPGLLTQSDVASDSEFSYREFAQDPRDTPQALVCDGVRHRVFVWLCSQAIGLSGPCE